MRQCPQCGGEVSDRARFCRHCSAPQPPAEAGSKPEPTVERSPAVVREEARERTPEVISPAPEAEWEDDLADIDEPAVPVAPSRPPPPPSAAPPRRQLDEDDDGASEFVLDQPVGSPPAAAVEEEPPAVPERPATPAPPARPTRPVARRPVPRRPATEDVEDAVEAEDATDMKDAADAADDELDDFLVEGPPPTPPTPPKPAVRKPVARRRPGAPPPSRAPGRASAEPSPEPEEEDPFRPPSMIEPETAGAEEPKKPAPKPKPAPRPRPRTRPRSMPTPTSTGPIEPPPLDRPPTDGPPPPIPEFRGVVEEREPPQNVLLKLLALYGIVGAGLGLAGILLLWITGFFSLDDKIEDAAGSAATGGLGGFEAIFGSIATFIVGGVAAASVLIFSIAAGILLAVLIGMYASREVSDRGEALTVSAVASGAGQVAMIFIASFMMWVAFNVGIGDIDVPTPTPLAGSVDVEQCRQQFGNDSPLCAQIGAQPQAQDIPDTDFGFPFLDVLKTCISAIPSALVGVATAALWHRRREPRL